MKKALLKKDPGEKTSALLGKDHGEKKGRRKSRKGAMELSFGMIFSIILIVVFLALAVYAILKILETQRVIKINTSIKDLSDDIDEMHKKSGGNYQIERSYGFPDKIEKVCFIDYECQTTSSKGCVRGRGDYEIYSTLEFYYGDGENLYFWPEKSSEGIDSRRIENINLEETTKVTNPYCIDVIDGKIDLILKRVEGSSLVIIQKN